VAVADLRPFRVPFVRSSCAFGARFAGRSVDVGFLAIGPPRIVLAGEGERTLHPLNRIERQVSDAGQTTLG
jgi:hypothetical protein